VSEKGGIINTPTPDILKASLPGAFPLAKEVFPLFHDKSARATERYPIQEKPKAAETLWDIGL